MKSELEIERSQLHATTERLATSEDENRSLSKTKEEQLVLIAGLRSEVVSLKDNCGSLETERISLRSQVKTLEKKLANLSTVSADLDALKLLQGKRADEAKAERDRLVGQIDKLRDQIDLKEEENAGLRIVAQEKVAIEERFSLKSEECSIAQHSLRESKSECDSLKATLSSRDAEIEDLKSKMTAREGEILQLHASLEELELHCQQVSAEIESCQTALQETEKKLSSVTSEFTLTKSALLEVESERDTLKREAMERGKELAAVALERDSLDRQIQLSRQLSMDEASALRCSSSASLGHSSALELECIDLRQRLREETAKSTFLQTEVDSSKTVLIQVLSKLDVLVANSDSGVLRHH